MDEETVSADNIKKCITPVLERGGAKRAILFGSYAKGKADRYSDIDLIIIADSKRPFIERFKDFSELWHVLPVKALDILVYTPKEFQKMRAQKNRFIIQAIEEGKLIYEAGPKTGSRPVATAGRE